MRKILFLIFIISSLGIKAQQVPILTEYMLNDYIYNPAMGGKNGIPVINIGYRTQWVGFEGAPKTFYLSGNGTIARKKKSKDMHDIGGFLYSDVTGPLLSRGVNASYTYHKEIFKDHELSMGMFLGVKENSLDINKITLPEKGLYDPAIFTSEFRRHYAPDGTIGMLFYNEDYYAGFSIKQIFGGRFNYGDSTHSRNNDLYSHYYLMGGYDFLISDDFILQPNILIKGVRSSPLQMDLNVKLNYKDLAFAGVSVRTHDAMSFLLGFDVKNVGEFGYAYDLGVSKFRRAHGGSHEIIITFRFDDYKRKSKFKSTPKLN